MRTPRPRPIFWGKMDFRLVIELMMGAVVSPKGTDSSRDRPDMYMIKQFTCLLHARADD